MYLPEHFAEERPEQLHALMRAYPLAALITQTEEGLDANHIPLELVVEQGKNGVLTREHEGQVAAQRPWKMTDSSPDYISQMLAAIVGIEIDIDRLVGKFKLSQNKDTDDIAGAVGALAAGGQGVLAEAMREHDS